MTLIAFAARADYETGQAAWDTGRHAEAVATWQEAASANDSRAMLALGRAFVHGLGVPQDYVEAHKWLNLAAGLGDADAAAERDALAAEMTGEERAEARKLARAWRHEGMPATAGAEPREARQPPADPPSSVDAPPERALREAQELLAALGYAPGPADGKWGRRSIEAFRSFLGDAGMEPSDVLTPEALRVMRSKARTPTSATEASELRQDALHRAVQAGDPDAVAGTLAAGADVDQRDGRGWTGLMHAANRGYVLMVPLLLEAGADTDLRAADGATALFMATAHGHSEIIAQLMEVGADMMIPGPSGKTAVDVARVRFGDLGTAHSNQENLAVLALIQGVTIAEAKALANLPPPGTTFRDCGSCPEMVVVPAGSFRMGSPASEEGRQYDEGPVRLVTMASPFAVGKYEVTFSEWESCVEDGGCGRMNPDDAGWGRGTRPIINVSWWDAKKYARWLSSKTGERYRLLSESEWEFAARAGSQTRYAWGDEIGHNRANCSGCGSNWDGASTAPVGSFAPNAFGLHDMHGNVWEWVEDCYFDSYAGAAADGAPRWQDNYYYRSVRGGSAKQGPKNVRSAVRYRGTTEEWAEVLGFRVAKTLAP